MRGVVTRGGEKRLSWDDTHDRMTYQSVVQFDTFGMRVAVSRRCGQQVMC